MFLFSKPIVTAFGFYCSFRDLVLFWQYCDYSRSIRKLILSEKQICRFLAKVLNFLKTVLNYFVQISFFGQELSLKTTRTKRHFPKTSVCNPLKLCRNLVRFTLDNPLYPFPASGFAVPL